MLDLFCGRWGWSKAFAKRGWHCVGIDLQAPPEVPQNCEFWCCDILEIAVKNKWFTIHDVGFNKTVACYDFDFICASPPCEQFSVHGMKHFHPNPKYPELGIKLFEHTRRICEESGVPYVIENVRAAQQFVGNAVHHCGPFYLWGSGVPVIIHRGIGKDMSQQRGPDGRRRGRLEHVSKKERASQGATIPPELANCVADYAERILENSIPMP